MPKSKFKHRKSAKVVKGIITPLETFLKLEASSGILLIIVTVVALVWANSPWREAYHHMVHLPIGLSFDGFSFEMSLHQWVNDALMVIFFFVVGLEIKSEMVMGELSTLKKASLPMFAALGGMVVPALIYHSLNYNGSGVAGWGIPMATDIAFAVGVLSLLGKRVPFALKIFLLALAIVDDLGAILVIAFFYTESIAPQAIGIAMVGFALVYFFEHAGVRSKLIYTILGVVIWAAVLKSGIHATVAGVLLGFMTPARALINTEELSASFKRLSLDIQNLLGKSHKDPRLPKLVRVKLEELNHQLDEAHSPLERIIHGLHPWVSYLIMPVFALVNAGVEFGNVHMGELVSNPITMGVLLGLFIGKPIGVVLAIWGATRLKLGELPKGVTWPHITCLGFLAGIGFTMALFVGNLALKDPSLQIFAKVGVLGASLASALVGLFLLNMITYGSTSQKT